MILFSCHVGKKDIVYDNDDRKDHEGDFHKSVHLCDLPLFLYPTEAGDCFYAINVAYPRSWIFGKNRGFCRESFSDPNKYMIKIHYGPEQFLKKIADFAGNKFFEHK